MVDIRTVPIYLDDVSQEDDDGRLPAIVTPGDEVSADSTFMRGHGTYVRGERICASVVGVVDSISRLHSITPFNCKYNGQVGDVVVGRVKDIHKKRWLIDVNARLYAVLHLSYTNLPGGERRVKGMYDETKMGKVLAEGDLISAEVHSIYHDGSLCLHTRNMRYGKLNQGTLVKVPPNLIRQKKVHFHSIVCGTQVILSNNGNVWIEPTSNQEETDGESSEYPTVSRADRDSICRLRNCIEALADNYYMLSETSILCAYDASMNYQAKEILKPEVKRQICNVVSQQSTSEGTM